MARNERSRLMTQGPQRAPNRALLRATGFTDTDFDKPVVGISNGANGVVVGHITPEAAVGGPLALLREGDRITIDADHHRLDVQLSEVDLANRQAHWHEPAATVKPGTVPTKYAKLVSSASEGAVTR